MEQKEIDVLVQQLNSRLIQTHISWIIFTGKNEVFKIKKPVRFSFLDFSTLDKRKHYCEEELRLNRRLAPELYMGVVKLVQRNGKYCFVDKINEGDKLIDYAVKMRELPQKQKMDQLLTANMITRSHIIALAYILANFHKKVEKIKERKYCSPELVKKQIDDIESVKEIVQKTCNKGKCIEVILEKCSKFISKNRKLMEKRQREGKIRDCHGDLHSGNIFYLDGKFYIFDCIEFNEYFRYIDVASEIAFMAMDLDAFGREDLSKLFVESYVKLTKDRELYKLLNLYKCYRANVRAKISALAIAQGGIEGNKENIIKYLDLCEKYARQL